MKKAILELYYETRENTSNTAEYNKMLKECDILKRKLFGSLSTKQKELLEEIEDIFNDLCEEKNRQYFKSGFILATRLITEAFYDEQKNEKI